MKKLLAMGIAGVFATGLAFAAPVQDSASTEASTAHAHALMAQNATTVAQAHTHLHHVINCLVGPQGTGFDATAGNPCKGQGNGAIPDSASNQTLNGKLKSALADAQRALQSDSLASVQKDAGKIAAELQAKKTGDGGSW